MANKLGVALTRCYFCGKDKNIIMNTRLTKEAAQKIEECNGKVIDMEPCDKCKELMKQGIMFASVRDGESGNNPYRTGKLAVIKEESVEKVVTKEMFDQLKKKRFAFIEDSLWKKLDLPTENKGE